MATERERIVAELRQFQTDLVRAEEKCSIELCDGLRKRIDTLLDRLNEIREHEGVST